MSDYKKQCIQAKKQKLEFISEKKMNNFHQCCYIDGNLSGGGFYCERPKDKEVTWLPSTDDLIEELEKLKVTFNIYGGYEYTVDVPFKMVGFANKVLKEALLEAIMFLKYKVKWEGEKWTI